MAKGQGVVELLLSTDRTAASLIEQFGAKSDENPGELV